MFGLSTAEIVVILILALIVLGPQKLPAMARQLARALNELRRVTDEIRSNFEEAGHQPPAPAALTAHTPEPGPDHGALQTPPPGTLSKDTLSKDTPPETSNASPRTASRAASQAQVSPSKPS